MNTMHMKTCSQSLGVSQRKLELILAKQRNPLVWEVFMYKFVSHMSNFHMTSQKGHKIRDRMQQRSHGTNMHVNEGLMLDHNRLMFDVIMTALKSPRILLFLNPLFLIAPFILLSP